MRAKDPSRALEVVGEERGLEVRVPEVDHLLRAVAGRTTVIVTHRLDGLDTVDEIVVLGSGRIVQRGTHAELITRPGWYRDAWLAQR